MGVGTLALLAVSLIWVNTALFFTLCIPVGLAALSIWDRRRCKKNTTKTGDAKADGMQALGAVATDPARTMYPGKRIKRIYRSRLFKPAAVLFMLTGLVTGGLVEAGSPLGNIVFRAGYAFPPTRPAFLSFYQWSLAEFEGGYLPSRAYEFLTNRISHCEGTREETAIIDFQIRQGSLKWGDAACRSHEVLQGKIISNIMLRLDQMVDNDAVSAMVRIEALRREDVIGKGGFTGMWTYKDNTDTLNRSAFNKAKASFKAWWNGGNDWPELKNTDPLAGTELTIDSGP